MKDQIDAYVRTLTNAAHASLYHHHEAESATSYGEFLAYKRVIAAFEGCRVGTVSLERSAAARFPS